MMVFDISLRPRKRSGSVLAGLVLFALALALPVTLFIGILLWQFATAERGRTIADAASGVANLAQTIDRELAGLVAAAEVLASTGPQKDDEIEAFRRRAVALSSTIGTQISLTGLDGRELANSAVPPGAPLARTDNKAKNLQSYLSGRTSISDLVFEGFHHFTVVAPVVENSEVKYFVHLDVPANRISRILHKGEFMPDTTLGVVDGQGRILARNVRAEEFVGQRATDDLLQNTEGRKGTWVGFTKDGQPIFGAFVRTELSGWRVVVGIPESQLQAPARRTLTITFMTGGVLAIVSALLAWRLGIRISRPLHKLAEQARSVGEGAEIIPLSSPIREVNEVSDSLVSATKNLDIRARQRDESERALQNLNERLEETVAARTEELRASNIALKEEMARRTASEEQIRQMQKLESLGQLTGGIAHDFNNMLTIITGGLDMLRRRLTDLDARSARYLDNAFEGARRAADLTQRLLAFSRRQALSPKPVDVNRLVQSISELLQRTINEDVRIETVLGSGLWRAHVDESQLENAILNLAVNARDAMPGGGRLTIETANAHLDETYAGHYAEVSPGQYVMVAVTDSGEGMSPEIIERALEPFFTTKEPGRGTGLGLSQVYGFVKQSGGHLKIYSEEDQGTTVKIYLPRLFLALEQDTESIEKKPLPRGSENETILVVEDEELVRTYSVEALRDLGYTVIEAKDAASALRVLNTSSRIDLLFTDIVMPDMNGKALAEAALLLRPGLKVLYTTGFTRNAIVHNGVLDAGIELLGKPFSLEQLSHKIRAILGGE